MPMNSNGQLLTVVIRHITCIFYCLAVRPSVGNDVI